MNSLNRLATIAIIIGCSMISSRAELPESREVNVSSWQGAAFFNIAVSRKGLPIRTQLLAGGNGFEVNTNQEILYQCNGNDMAGLMNKIGMLAMIFTMEVPTLEKTEGVIPMVVDGKNAEVRVSHMQGHSRVDIYLANKYVKTPAWQPWEKKRKLNERPFFLKTVRSAIDQLSPAGQGESFMPKFYSITYCTGVSLGEIDPTKDITLQYPKYAAQLVVPLVFEDQKEWGARLRSGQYAGMDFLMVAAKRNGIPAIKAYVGAFGLRISAKREFVFEGGGTLVSRSRHYKTGPMIVTLKTGKKLPLKEGTHTKTADKQDLEFSVAHAGDASRLAIKLPAQYNRGPYWLPKSWGGKVLSSYPGHSSENGLCCRTVKALIDALVSNPREYYPDYYQVNYTNGNGSLQVSGASDITMQRSVPILVGVPFASIVPAAISPRKAFVNTGLRGTSYSGPFGVYNLAGRLIRSIDPNTTNQTIGYFWDGRDKVGNLSPAGVYIMRVHSGDRLETRKILHTCPK